MVGPHADVQPAALPRALQCARGSYQRALVEGWRVWSGADMTGRARHYGAHYARSRAALFARLLAAGLDARLETRARGKRVLVICA
jgi:hypothetical protein